MKQKTMQEVFHTLRPDGEVHVVDFEKPQTKGILPHLFSEVGFEDIRQIGQYNAFVDTLQSYYARKYVTTKLGFVVI